MDVVDSKTSRLLYLVWLSCVGIIAGLIIFYLPKYVDYSNAFEKPIEYAVSESNPQRAATQLQLSISYLEDIGVSDRDLCVWVYSPMCDTKLFYSKLVESRDLLNSLDNVDLVGESTALIRFRESFVTTNSAGEKIGFPLNLATVAIFGSNLNLAWWLNVIYNTLVFGGIVVFILLSTILIVFLLN